jgi:hypothetical protein
MAADTQLMVSGKRKREKCERRQNDRENKVADRRQEEKMSRKILEQARQQMEDEEGELFDGHEQQQHQGDYDQDLSGDEFDEEASVDHYNIQKSFNRLDAGDDLSTYVLIVPLYKKTVCYLLSEVNCRKRSTWWPVSYCCKTTPCIVIIKVDHKY